MLIIIYYNNTDISFEFGLICVWVMVFLAVPAECTFIQSCGGGMLGESWSFLHQPKPVQGLPRGRKG